MDKMNKSDIELAGCLRRLFRSRFVLRSRNERWFKIIIDNRERIDELVARFGAVLEINEPLGLCYVRTRDEAMDDQLGIRLARSKTLSPLGSALILKLRWQRLQFFLQPSGDDVPVVSVKDLREFLSSFCKTSVDTQFERQFRRSLDELVQLQVLVETSSESGFFEITSLCDHLLPADRIRELETRIRSYFERQSPSESSLEEGVAHG